MNAVNATPSVSFTWDPYFKRLVSMSDGTGTTRYSYGAPFQLGALQRTGECFVATGGSTCGHQITYGYDELGRVSSRSVSGAGTETYQYDAIGRVTDHLSDLGDFAISYLGQTNQIALRKLVGSGATLQTAWSYLPNSGDRRLAGINNTGLSASQYSNFAFATKSENEFTSITETTDGTEATPASVNQNASCNALNQLTNLSGQAQTYDANGNLLSDGQRSYAWDAENRLIAITYLSQSGKATNFVYDGVGRRTCIVSRPAGGGSSQTRNFVWCGDQICQARDASYALTRHISTRENIYQDRRRRPISMAPTSWARFAVCLRARRQHRPTTTIPTASRFRLPPLSLTSAMRRCSQIPKVDLTSPGIGRMIPASDGGSLGTRQGKRLIRVEMCMHMSAVIR
jgi:YD repeat-containing protein